MPPWTAQNLDCDVLVLGAGLAGMRAAWAAVQTVPGLHVVLASPWKSPSGSSFANRNNALGMQVPMPAEAEAFVREVLRLAPPGLVRPELVQAAARDAPARLADLLSLGFRFRRAADGRLRRFSGCFSQRPRAAIFDDLSQAHAAFAARLRMVGVEMLPGCLAIDLSRDADGRVCGARLAALRGPEPMDVRAKSVVAALGGPAALFARRICGPAASGLSYGLLAGAGARIVNAPYVQFFWVTAREGNFVNPGELVPSLGTPQGSTAATENATALAASRRGHCPIAYGLPDKALDMVLLAQRDAHGFVRLPDGRIIAPAAHAGNGGALIDDQGDTGVPGLYACGECAGGMHGADRIGGGAVLAALVFGARAGAAAAREAAGRTDGKRLPAGPRMQRRPDPAFLALVRRGMQRHGLPGARERGTAAAGRETSRLEAFLERLRREAREGTTGNAALARSALAVLASDARE